MNRHTLTLLCILFIVVDVGASNQTLRGSASQDCGKHYPRRGTNRIASGYAAARGEYPSYVQVHGVHVAHGNTVENECGGTIIDERLVVTAEHCLRKPGTRLVRAYVEAGSTEKYQGVRFLASSFCVPEEEPDLNQYPERANSDIGILVLERAIEFDDFIQPACLPSFELSRFTLLDLGI